MSFMAIFISYPYLAGLIGMLLIGVGRLTRHRTPIVVGIVWVLYALYETGMKHRWLCSGECNIRVDLLLIYPVLLLLLLVAGLSLLRAPAGPR
jgi:hypothetical protein